MRNLRTLTQYISKYKHSYLLGGIFVILSNLLIIFAIRYISEAIDALANADAKVDKSILFSNLMQYATLFIGLNVLAGVFRYFQRQTLIVASRKIEFDLRENIFRQYTLLPLQFYKENRIGDLMNRITEDVANVRMYLGPAIMYLINLASLLLIVPPFMFYYDWELALIALLPLPILSIVIYFVTRTIYKKSLLVQQNQSLVSSFVQDTFSGIRVVKSFVKEKFTFDKYDELTENYRQSNLSLALTNALFFPSVAFIIGLNYVLVVYMGGVRYFEGAVSIGNIIAFFSYINVMVWPFISLGWIASLIQKAEVSMERINEFLKESTERNSVELDKYPLLSGDIEFRNVSYTYPNTGIQALKNVSFIIERNKNLAIFGETGSGKTTIALLLLGLIEPDEGNIYINRQNIANLPLNQLRESIGYIPQDSFLFSDTIENNLNFANKKLPLETLKDFAEKADIHDNISEFQNQYQTKVGERGVTLSGGQKQRVSIARALVKQAPILLFDDALSAVDTETEETILKNIETDFEDKTILVITHRVSSAKNADKIIYLKDGEIIEEGKVDEVMERKGPFYKLYQKQILEKELDY